MAAGRMAPPDDVSGWFELKPKEAELSQHRGLTPIGSFVLVGLAVAGVVWFVLRSCRIRAE
jgi:hypothetical protein